MSWESERGSEGMGTGEVRNRSRILFTCARSAGIGIPKPLESGAIIWVRQKGPNLGADLGLFKHRLNDRLARAAEEEILVLLAESRNIPHVVPAVEEIIHSSGKRWPRPAVRMERLRDAGASHEVLRFITEFGLPPFPKPGGLPLECRPEAQKAIEALPLKHRKQISRRIEELRFNPSPHDSKSLTGCSYRRVDNGEYRIIYDTTQSHITILRVGKRNDDTVYRGLDQL
jgi:mRNA interferase RelE/StbE